MEGLIALVVVVLLVVLSFAVVMVALPSFLAGLFVAVIAMFVVFKATTRSLTSREHISKTLDFSIHDNAVAWRLREERHNFADSGAWFGSILGSAASGLVGYHLLQSAPDADAWLYVLAIIVNVVVTPFCIFKMNPRKIFAKMLNSEVDSTMRPFESNLAGLSDLRLLQESINDIAEELEISLRVDYCESIENSVKKRAFELIFEPTFLSTQIRDAVVQASTEESELLGARGTLQQLRHIYVETARAVNRTNSISLITEADWLGAGLKPENLPALLAERKWNDFRETACLMKEDMAQLKSRAERHGSRAPSEPEESGRITRKDAFKVLGISEGVSFAAIKAAWRDAVKKYNVDQRQSLEPHIKEMIEERFKAINLAFELLKNESISIP